MQEPGRVPARDEANDALVNHERVAVAEYDRALEAAVSAGCEVIVPIRPLDLLNDVTQKPWPVRVAFFRGPDGELIELLEDKTG